MQPPPYQIKNLFKYTFFKSEFIIATITISSLVGFIIFLTVELFSNNHVNTLGISAISMGITQFFIIINELCSVIPKKFFWQYLNFYVIEIKKENSNKITINTITLFFNTNKYIYKKDYYLFITKDTITVISSYDTILLLKLYL